jgi:hypothetical protein
MVTFKMLHAHQREALREWRDGTTPGLWVYGARRGGSSSIGRIAYEHIEEEGAAITALHLTDAVRRMWSSSSVSKAHPNDYDLYVDANRAEDEINRYWTVPLLFVDDFHEEQIDMGFWRKHIQARIEHRLNDNLRTIIASDMAPNHPYLSGLQGLIEDLFVTCYAER